MFIAIVRENVQRIAVTMFNYDLLLHEIILLILAIRFP